MALGGYEQARLDALELVVCAVVSSTLCAGPERVMDKQGRELIGLCIKHLQVVIFQAWAVWQCPVHLVI